MVGRMKQVWLIGSQDGMGGRENNEGGETKGHQGKGQKGTGGSKSQNVGTKGKQPLERLPRSKDSWKPRTNQGSKDKIQMLKHINSGIPGEGWGLFVKCVENLKCPTIEIVKAYQN